MTDDETLFRQAMEELGVERGKEPEDPAPRSLRQSTEWDFESEDAIFLQAMASDRGPLEAESPEVRAKALAEPPPNPAQPRTLADDEDALGLRESFDDEGELFRRAMADLGATLDKDFSGPDPDAATKKPRLRKAPSERAVPKVEDHLDLHRETRRRALAQLSRFIAASHAAKLRWVLVVTGKGHHSPDGVSVLRRAVEHWILTEGRGRVRSYSPAPRSLGGRGAFLIELG